MNGYEKTYETMRLRLADRDLSAAATALGLSAPIDGVLNLDFLGRQWRVDRLGVTQVGGNAASVNCKTVIVYYLTHGGGGFPQYDFVFLKSFASGLFDGSDGVTSAERGRLTDYARFVAIARRLNAEFLRETANGSHTWLFYAFPKVPVQLTFIEGDDEFPAQTQIKFDVTATTFLPFETLAVLNGLISGELAGKDI
ncbi:MAG: DUF3786 domain-containing protein [Oscillospiraceae bacterium]|jgi:hypothetical protein|nr:DUF3786 domain-containing protein [Oscillospiraceae bacterium]